jgi:hypothetical protein
VETEQAKMAEAVAGIVFLLLWNRDKSSSLQSDVLLH